MNNYKATFADGQEITINTKRTCNVAYKIVAPEYVLDGEVSPAFVITGFSLSAKAAQAQVSQLKASPFKRDVSKGAMRMREANAKFFAGCKIEIVEAVQV